MTPGAVVGLASAAGATWALYYGLVRTSALETAAKRPYNSDARSTLAAEVRAEITKVAVAMMLHLPLSLVMWVATARAVGSIDLAQQWDPNGVAVAVVGALCLVQLVVLVADLRALAAAQRHARGR